MCEQLKTEKNLWGLDRDSGWGYGTSVAQTAGKKATVWSRGGRRGRDRRSFAAATQIKVPRKKLGNQSVHVKTRMEWIVESKERKMDVKKGAHARIISRGTP